MTTSTYVEYSPEAGTWALPAEHAPVLAQEGGPVFFGGTFQMLHGMSSVYDELLEVFRTGGGVRQEAYHQDMWDGMERFTGGWFENHLVQEWMPDLPDAVDPAGLQREIRESLRPGRAYVCLDINASDHLEENVGPLGALFHGCSLMYCMTTSLAHGGEGLGTVGFNEDVARRMCAEAGFSSVRRVPMENPFNILYEIRP